MVEFGIQQLVVANEQFIAIAGSRFYPVLLPEGSPSPSATYQVISVTPLYTLTDRVNVTQMRLQIDIWASGYVQGKTLAAAVTTILDRFSGELPNTTHVFGIQLRNITDFYQHEALTNRVMLEFDVQFAA